jgi:hypothetical protein
MDGYEEGCVAKNRDDCQRRGMTGKEEGRVTKQRMSGSEEG